MLGHLNHFHDAAVGGKAGELQAMAGKIIPIIIVYFITVAVPFVNHLFTV
jgi:hypothetical protein